MIVVTATFIGKDSLGYKNGLDYKLQLSKSGSNSIQRIDGSGICFYASLSAFLRNWSNIKVESF